MLTFSQMNDNKTDTIPDKPEPRKILLVDDDVKVLALFERALKDRGHTVVTANSRHLAHEAATREHFDLLITDMMMPRMGGFPVLEFLRTLATPPKVIMITANEGGRHKAYAEMLGAVDYLRKPFAMEVLLEAVQRAIGGGDADKKPNTTRRRVLKKKDDDADDEG